MPPARPLTLITGASAGIGAAFARDLAARGHDLVLTARRVERLETLADELRAKHHASVTVLPADLADPAAVAQLGTALDERGLAVDWLVNNAGYGIAGALEEATEAEFMPVFETNVFGLIRVTRAFLPHLRKQRSGHILNLSSIAGLAGGPGWGFYNTTKFAVEGFSEALAAELAPLGIHVTLIEPGPFRTDFLGRSGVEAAHRIADYDTTAGKAREYLNTQSGKQAGDPLRAVHAMMAVVDSPNPPLHLILGAIALKRFRTKLDQWNEEIAAWEPTTLGADFPEGQ